MTDDDPYRMPSLEELRQLKEAQRKAHARWWLAAIRSQLDSQCSKTEDTPE